MDELLGIAPLEESIRAPRKSVGTASAGGEFVGIDVSLGVIHFIMLSMFWFGRVSFPAF